VSIEQTLGVWAIFIIFILGTIQTIKLSLRFLRFLIAVVTHRKEISISGSAISVLERTKSVLHRQREMTDEEARKRLKKIKAKKESNSRIISLLRRILHV